MKTKKIVCMMTAALAVGMVSAQYVQDFQSFPAGNLTGASGSTLGSISDGNAEFLSGSDAGSSRGIREVIDESGNKFVRLARNFSTSQGLTIGELITLNDAGLTVGETYQLSFDYRIGRVGSENYQNVEFRFGAMQDNGGFAEFTGVESSLNNFAEGGHGGTILHNYSDTTFTTIPPASQPVTDWTTHTFTDTFTYTAGNSTIGWLISVQGFGSGNAAWDGTDYTYIDIDNVSIIPEPSTLALLGIALGSAVFFRRRKH